MATYWPLFSVNTHANLFEQRSDALKSSALDHPRGAARRGVSMDNTEPKEPSEPFDFDFHKALAVAGYQRVRPSYESFAQVVQGILIQALITANIKVASVDARAKSVESFKTKAARPNVDIPIAQPTRTL